MNASDRVSRKVGKTVLAWYTDCSIHVSGEERIALQRAVTSLVMRERRNVWRKAIEIAGTAHPQEGSCCFEDPDGHRGSVATAEAISEKLQALYEQERSK